MVIEIRRGLVKLCISSENAITALIEIKIFGPSVSNGSMHLLSGSYGFLRLSQFSAVQLSQSSSSEDIIAALNKITLLKSGVRAFVRGRCH